MKKNKQNRYASQIGVSVIGGKVFSGKRKKVTAEDAKGRMMKHGKEVQG